MNEEPQNPDEPQFVADEQQEYHKYRRPFSKLAIDLEPEDLAQKGVQKMILSEISRLENEVEKLSSYEKKFHDKDKTEAVLRVRLRKDTKLEILYSVAIAIGSALIGWMPSSSSFGGTIAVCIMAIALLLFALLAKWGGGKDEG